MAARPVPTSDKINAAIVRARIGQGRALLRLLRTMPEADILAGLGRYGLDDLRRALQHAAGRMEMRAELRADRRRGAAEERRDQKALRAALRAVGKPEKQAARP